MRTVLADSRNEPAGILSRFDQIDRDALKVELGYSGEVEWRVFNEDAGLVIGKEWEGYNLELLGIVLGRYSESTIPAEGVEFYERVGTIARTLEGFDIVQPSLLRPFTCIPDSTDPDLIIQLCRIRAHYKDSPLYGEMRAQSYGVRRVAIHGLEYKYNSIDLERAAAGRELLVKIAAPAPHIGRPLELQGQTLANIAESYAWLCFCFHLTDQSYRPPIEIYQTYPQR